MVPEGKQILLDRFLGQLPGHLAGRLAKAVEVDRLIGGKDLPHDALLNALRPQLRQLARRARMPTPQRFFCRPFEDLLVDEVPRVKQKGRISRVSIAPVWHWVANDLIPDAYGAATVDLTEAVLSDRMEQIHAGLKKLWSAAAPAMTAALDGEGRRAEAARRLGSLVVAEDAAEMALLITAGTELMLLQDRLPRPLYALGEHEIAVLRDAFENFNEAQPDIAPYVVLIAMARLERPWEALNLMARISGRSTDTMISNTDAGLAGELLFCDLDRYTQTITAMRPLNLDADRLLEALGAFAELSTGMVKEVGITRHGKWGQRLTKARARVSEAMEVLVERAPKEVLHALPGARVGGFGRGPRPLDLNHPPDPEKSARAMRYAQILAHAKPFAVAAAFHAKLSAVTEELAEALRNVSEDLLRELKAARPEEQAHAQAHFALLLDLFKLVLGEEEAKLLRRRSRISPHA
jgi:hypothetical protein